MGGNCDGRRPTYGVSHHVTPKMAIASGSSTDCSMCARRCTAAVAEKTATTAGCDAGIPHHDFSSQRHLFMKSVDYCLLVLYIKR